MISRERHGRLTHALVLLSLFALAIALAPIAFAQQVGQEVAIPTHLQDGQEFTTPMSQLIKFGQQLFNAKFTIQEGAGRPMSKGTGAPISDPSSPLVFPRNFDRLSSPEANSCAGCHNAPASGGGGDRVTEVFVLAQRFDHLTFDHNDMTALRGAVDESGKFVTMDNATNDRKTIGMNGSGFVEMLARQITGELQAIAAALPAGMSAPLTSPSTGISFGTLTHNADGTWNTSAVKGLAAPSMATTTTTAPSLVIMPLHQAGAVVSIRQFTNNAMNHHHGMQSEERFGLGVDADGDGVVNELTTADITAISMFQATMNVPQIVIPGDNLTVATAIVAGEQLFDQIGCNSCHMDSLPLVNNNWIYSEPNPYNPVTGGGAPNLVPGPTNYPISAPALSVDLTSSALPKPRLKMVNGVVNVPAYTDLKLHDISATSNAASDPECEPLDQNQNAKKNPSGFFAGNCKFITRKLWGFYNQGGAFMHHGKFTTAREAVLAHAGEAAAQTAAFNALTADQQNDVIEFLKSLQVVPAK